MILAGDLGGTKCNVALFRVDQSALQVMYQCRYQTRDYTRFEDVVVQFCRDAGVRDREKINAAGFGVPGTILDGRLYANNLPWVLDKAALARTLGLHPQEIVLLNDLVATAYGLDRLAPSDFLTLNEGVRRDNASRALIAAGTGLGEAILFWDGQRHHAVPSEGCLADFAPRTERELELFRVLKKQLPHICCEEILSGRGFRTIHEFLDPSLEHRSFTWPGNQAAREITEQALAGSCPVCVETLDLWTEAYGAEAGNLALRAWALGGIYVAGGIALRILPKLKDGTFVRGFCQKANLVSTLQKIPIHVVLNEDAPVWGAAYKALAILQQLSLPVLDSAYRS